MNTSRLRNKFHHFKHDKKKKSYNKSSKSCTKLIKNTEKTNCYNFNIKKIQNDERFGK